MQIMTDTNILTRIRDADDPNHEVCVEALRRLRVLGHKPSFCAQICIEYWSVATRPRNVNGIGLTTAEAQEDLQDYIDALDLLPEPPDMARRWLDVVTRYDVRGKQVHDAPLATLMLAHGVTHLLTLNGTDFARYEGIICVHPSNIEDILHGGP